MPARLMTLMNPSRHEPSEIPIAIISVVNGLTEIRNWVTDDSDNDTSDTPSGNKTME
jgi:hypothetical protein